MTLPEPAKLLPEPVSERLQILHMMLHFMDREGERYWHRNGVFVAIVSGLFGLYLAKFDDFAGPFSIAYGIFGVVIGLGWLQVLRTGKYYALRWRLDAKEYVKQFPELENSFRAAAGNPRIHHPGGGKSSDVMRVFAGMTILVSLGVFGLGIWQVQARQTPSSSVIRHVCISLQDGKVAQIVDCARMRGKKH